VFKDNPQIKKVSIEGHASAEGDPKRNLTLSDERAKAVMKYIVDHGIDAKRLTAKGFGSSKPIADNETEEGREKNRRVEFNIVEQDVTSKKVEIDAKTGKEKVLEEKTSEVKKAEEAPAPAAADKDKKKEAQPKPGALKAPAPKAPAPAAPKAPAPAAAPKTGAPAK